MKAWRAWLRRPAALPARLFAALLAMAPLQAPQAGTLAAMLEAPLESSEHAAAHAATAQHAEGPAPVRARHQGGFYRISGHGRVAYLLGTVHVGQASFYPLAPEAQRVLAGADNLVVELDTGANEAFTQAVARHGRYPDGGDIRKRLAPETLARLSDALHAEGVSVASMAHLKPWLIANLLLSMRLEREGFRRSEGVEEQLLTQARRRGIKVVQLESADAQLALFDSMNDIESERYLRETLDGLADGSVLRKAGRIIEAWRTGEPAALDALLPEATAGGTTIADFTRRKLLGRRNADMAAHIDTLMTHGGGVIFVGVGLLHLLGDNGLPALLAQRGYLVERVY
ncbi:TraB/GumN family protein [Massilia sp.]|uniref:TraB/GumN family protein n=1 Tax=Massilia sp. TaxID=1882437 RepID=UPI0028A90155|nr:TraB/GumN family protein [Massilia sp.]